MGAKLQFVCLSKTERLENGEKVWDVDLMATPEPSGGRNQYGNGRFELTIYDSRLEALFSVGESYTADFSLGTPD